MSTPLRIAVTGGSGNVGSFVVRELLSRGHTVWNLDRKLTNKHAARFVYLDVTKREQIQPVLEQVDAVIHLAEISHQSFPFTADHIFSYNIAACSTVMQTAADLKLKRAIYTSTCQVYGWWDHPIVPPLHLPFDETHPLQPQNIYSLSKTTNESYARFAAERFGLSVAIFRLPWVWSHDFNGDFTWLTGGKPNPDGFGTYCHATDVARAYALAIENPRPGCEAYHLSAAEVISRIPLRQLIAEHRPGWPTVPENWPAFKTPMILEKAKAHLGWEPQWNIVQMYREKHGKLPNEA